MQPGLRFILATLLLAAAASALPSSAEQEPAAHQRTFLFTYAGAVTGLTPGAKVRVWLPVPPTNHDQQIELNAEQLPAAPRLGKDPQYGNPILYFETAASANTLSFTRTYRITRREVTGPTKDDAADAVVQRFLEADRLVPVDGQSLEELLGKLPELNNKPLPKDPTVAARVLYDVVNAHLRYDKSGTGWGRGDARWACDHKRGNCTDFHSLFIALARAHKIPARFEIGFGLPEKRGSGEVPGYHCWAKFRAADQGWMSVDIAEANKDPRRKDYYFGHLTADRVAFSEGRDLTLAPKQDGPPLNFFVAPYVEVNGQPYPADQVRSRFSYQDRS